MLFWRSDGTRLRGLDPMRRMMPMLMPTRNEAVVYYEQIIDATALLAFLDAHNAGAGPKLTPLPCVVAALGRVVTARPADLQSVIDYYGGRSRSRSTPR